MACCHDPRCPTSEPPYDTREEIAEREEQERRAVEALDKYEQLYWNEYPKQ